MTTISALLSKKPYLAWYVKDPKNLSVESVLEHVLNYGDWDDYQEVEKTMGIKQVKAAFDRLKGKKRHNLREKTISYFNKYYQRYA